MDSVARLSRAPAIHQCGDGDIAAHCATIMRNTFGGQSHQSNHASAVAAVVTAMGGSPTAVAAAYLHDLAEDATPPGEEPAAFLDRLGVPDEVARVVLAVTRHVMGEESYADYIARIVGHQGPERELAIMVKHADLLVNRARCVGDPEFKSLLERYEKALRRLAPTAGQSRAVPEPPSIK